MRRDGGEKWEGGERGTGSGQAEGGGNNGVEGRTEVTGCDGRLRREGRGRWWPRREEEGINAAQ